jgi:hypothetical protein
VRLGWVRLGVRFGGLADWLDPMCVRVYVRAHAHTVCVCVCPLALQRHQQSTSLSAEADPLSARERGSAPKPHTNFWNAFGPLLTKSTGACISLTGMPAGTTQANIAG